MWGAEFKANIVRRTGAVIQGKATARLGVSWRLLRWKSLLADRGMPAGRRAHAL